MLKMIIKRSSPGDEEGMLRSSSAAHSVAIKTTFNSEPAAGPALYSLFIFPVLFKPLVKHHCLISIIMQLTATLILSLLAHQVAGHAAIIKAVGDAGGSGMAIGVDTATPRDGTRRDPFQQDSTRFKGEAADTVGETLGGGANNLEAGTTAIMGETGDALPQVTQGGEIKMVSSDRGSLTLIDTHPNPYQMIHQVNADGAGPYSCSINNDATAATWQDSKCEKFPY